uniref:Uncharacterized protein n=1 Tax=Echeneis naucrates TaxID=173247 RepID=A0A665TM57_ECHNA
MYRTPVRPQRSPGAPRPAGRFPSPVWCAAGSRSPYGGSGYRGGSPRGCHAYSPSSPVCSPGSNRGCWDGSAAGFGGGPRGFGGQMRRRGDGFRRPRSFSPGSAQNVQVRFQVFSRDDPIMTSELVWVKSGITLVEKYFSPSMMQDPWAALQPIRVADAAATRLFAVNKQTDICPERKQHQQKTDLRSFNISPAVSGSDFSDFRDQSL